MNTSSKLASVVAVSAMLILGATGCSSAPEASPQVAISVDKAELTPAKAAAAIESFVAAVTTEEVSKDFPEGANKETFAKAVTHIDPAASVDEAAKVLADFAMAQYSAAKSKVTVDVEVSKVKVSGETATVPVTAVVVKAGGKKIANSEVLGEQINDLVFSEGAWVITFPKSAASTAATSSPTTAAVTTAPVSKK